MYGINVVNFSPFLSYALFGGAVAAITVTKHGTISADFWVEGFFVEKSLTEGLSSVTGWPSLHFLVICDNSHIFRLLWPGDTILHPAAPVRQLYMHSFVKILISSSSQQQDMWDTFTMALFGIDILSILPNPLHCGLCG